MMSSKSIWRCCEDSDLSGFTVIIPSVAVGNVGQLACDLLISSCDIKKCASIYSQALIPVVGYDPYDLHSTDLSTCFELYQCPSRSVAVVQLRAPLVYKFSHEFLEDLVKSLKEKGVKDIIILTSSFAHEKKHIQSSPFRYVANELCPYKPAIKEANWLAHERQGEELKIYGGGFATLMYKICVGQGVPCLVLFKYCSEGDNIPDAYDMLSCLTQVVPLFDDHTKLLSNLIQPVSWKLLYGRPPPKDIY